MPCIRFCIIDSPGVERLPAIRAAPNQHLRASPDGGMPEPRLWCIGETHRLPRIRCKMIPSACVDISRLCCSSPDEHHFAVPHGGVSTARTRRAFSGHRQPNACLGGVNRSCLHRHLGRIQPAPDDELCACPHCAVKERAFGGLMRFEGFPCVGFRGVTTAGIEVSFL